MMSFDAFLNQPHLCRECGAEIPADVAEVDIDDEGRTVATCDECRNTATATIYVWRRGQELAVTVTGTPEFFTSAYDGGRDIDLTDLEEGYARNALAEAQP